MLSRQPAALVDFSSSAEVWRAGNPATTRYGRIVVSYAS